MEKTKKPTKKQMLVERASKYPDYDKNVHKTIQKLEAFLATKEAVAPTPAVPAPKPKKATKKEKLVERASKYPDYQKGLHNTIAKLEAFLAGKAPVEMETAPAVQADEMMKMSIAELRKLAKSHGWNKRTGTKVELIAFIRSKTSPQAVQKDRMADQPPTIVPHLEPIEEDIDVWPVSPDVLQKHSNTVDNLKKLLKAKGIAVGLPRTKKEILELFHHSRCSFKDFTCSENEFCDLRNNLCRDLNILRNKDNEIKKLAKGLVYLDEEKGRFYGTPEAIARVRQLLVPEIGTTTTTPPPPVATQVVVQEETKQEKPHDEEQEGISPININRLLDKPSENEIRRAILHCLGLYHDIDPNDEIILRPT